MSGVDEQTGQEPVADEPPRRSTSQRVAINAVSNWLGQGVQVAVNMFLLAYVLPRLDEVRFGVFRLAVSLSVGVRILSFGMAASVLRLASESLAARDWRRLAEILSVARGLLVLLAVVGVAVMMIVSVSLLGPLKVPEAHRGSAALLIQLTALSAGFHLVTIVYGGALRAKQRYDLANAVIVGEMVLQVVVVVVCFEAGWVTLEVLGLARVTMALFALVASAILLRRVLPEVRLPLLRFSKETVRGVVSFGGWTAVKHVTRAVLDQGCVPFVSAVFGVAAVTAIAIPAMVARGLFRMVTGLTLTLWPIAAKYSLEGRRKSVGRLYRVATRLTVMMLVPVTVVLVTHGQPLIRSLKPGLEWTYYLMLVYMGLFFVRAAFVAADHVILASGRIRPVVIMQAGAAALGFALALASVVWTDWGLYGVIVGLFAPLALHSMLYLPYRIREQTGVDLRTTFLECVAGPLVGGVAPLAAGWLLVWVWPPGNIWWVILQMGVCVGIYAGVGWLWILSPGERTLLLGVFRPARATAPVSEPPSGIQ